MGMTLPFTERSFLVETRRLYPAMRRAFEIARSGRPGPVLVDVPKDVQFAATSDNGYRRLQEAPPPVESPGLERAAMLLRAKRPLILAGHGVTLGGAEMELRLLAERTGIPVVTTLLGISAFPTTTRCTWAGRGCTGRPASTAPSTAPTSFSRSGCASTNRITGAAHKFAPNAKVVHIDIDPSELGKVIKPTIGMPQTRRPR